MMYIILRDGEGYFTWVREIRHVIAKTVLGQVGSVKNIEVFILIYISVFVKSSGHFIPKA